MESSSEDGSFVWTDASNSTSSEDMMTNMAGGHSGGEESEYDKSYKKKLHKELYTNENGHEKEVRTKKRKRERYTSGSEHSETSRKKIKVEPESDLDVARVEEKHIAVNGYDEHLLDEKVKREQEFLLPTDKIRKKKRKKSTSNENVEIHIKDTELNRTEEKPSNESNTEDSSSRVDCEAEASNHQDQYNVTKKKKKKKTREKIEESPHVMEIGDNCNQNTIQQQTSISNESRKKDTPGKEKQSVNVSQDLTMNSTTADLDISEISKISNVNITQDESENNKTRRRLSERIQFEDNIVDSEPSRDILAREPSNKLKQFAQKHKLRLCSVRELTEFTIGDRDEVWVVTCPGDVDVAAFAGRSLELEGRCKVKLHGAAYEGGAEPAAAGAGVAAALLAGAGVRRVPLAGRLALHRRVPRAPAAAPPSGPAPAARVSLPDTKLRHPLLGAHYKKALKLPPAVRERLHVAPAPVSAPAPAPKRRRKSESPPAPTSAPVPVPVPTKKKAKRKKHDLEAPETWESERAIEESLFEF